MYVPILKTRQCELLSVSDVKFCFSDTIIPLFEVTKDEYLTRYEIDSKTGKIRTEPFRYSTGKVVNKKVEAEKTEADIITLEDLNERMDDKKMFVDFFRYHIDEYRNKNVNVSALTLSLKLKKDSYYKKRLIECLKFKNIIPVISLKEKFQLPEEDIEELSMLFHNEQRAIAIRIESSLLEEYQDVLETVLGKRDFLLVDIRHNAIDSKIMDLEDLQDYEIKAKKILLNSPRDESIYNTHYEENGLTELIDNSVRDRYEKLGFDGYGDYAGMADKLPSKGQGARGSATALLYRYDRNQFEIFRNPDSSLAMKGFTKVYKDVMKAEGRLNPDKDCAAYKILHKAEKVCSWQFWIRICITRYIHQVYKYM